MADDHIFFVLFEACWLNVNNILEWIDRVVKNLDMIPLHTLPDKHKSRPILRLGMS